MGLAQLQKLPELISGGGKFSFICMRIEAL